MDMLDILLQNETPESRQAILTELFERYGQDHEKILDEIVPHFSFDFSLPGTIPEHAEEETRSR